MLSLSIIVKAERDLGKEVHQKVNPRGSVAFGNDRWRRLKVLAVLLEKRHATFSVGLGRRRMCLAQTLRISRMKTKKG